MALSTEQQARLDALRAAYDELIMGKRVAEVTSAGRTVKYSQADKASLLSTIEGLECLSTPGGRRRGAIGFRL